MAIWEMRVEIMNFEGVKMRRRSTAELVVKFEADQSAMLRAGLDDPGDVAVQRGCLAC